MSDYLRHSATYRLTHSLIQDDSQDVEKAQKESIAELERARIEILKVLKDANEACRSAHSIAWRHGNSTNWDAFITMLDKSLDEQRAFIKKLEAGDGS